MTLLRVWIYKNKNFCWMAEEYAAACKAVYAGSIPASASKV